MINFDNINGMTSTPLDKSIIPYKGIFLFFLSLIFSMIVIIYFMAWESSNKLSQDKSYETSWLEEGSIFLCPLH